ncbi:MAG: SdpI family protein [Candidatus ainarchaeum sp.]|nr:SdpI family protein [Candidatus ainarchaeum sp.]
MDKMKIILFILVLLTFVVGIVIYPYMPGTVASHWNAAGEVDGHMSKFWGVFLMPIICLVCILLFIFIPKMDPLKKNFKAFEKEFNLFILVIFLFFFYIYLLTIFWNLGYDLNIGKYITPAFGILFIFVGLLLRKAKRNYFVGIRTPWTLANDKVWDKTHQLGFKLFVIIGVVCFLGIFFPEYTFYIFIGLVLLVTGVLFLYSYLIYRRG